MKAHVEQIISQPRNSFVCRNFKETSFEHPFHFHPEIEITYIVSSSGTRIVGDHVGNFEPGDLCLIGENLPHVYRNPIPPPQGAESEVLHISRDCAHGFLDAAPELKEFADLLDLARLGLKFDRKTADMAGVWLTRIREAIGVRRWTYFLELVEGLVRAPTPQILASPGYAGAVGLNTSERMHAVCQYILEHFDEDLSHEMLAKRVHISPAYFSRLFKQTTRKTYQEFLTDVRLGHACHLLMETDRPILEIAFQSGFRNLSSFNRQFLKAYKCSPRDYRKGCLVGEG